MIQLCILTGFNCSVALITHIVKYWVDSDKLWLFFVGGGSGHDLRDSIRVFINTEIRAVNRNFTWSVQRQTLKHLAIGEQKEEDVSDKRAQGSLLSITVPVGRYRLTAI